MTSLVSDPTTCSVSSIETTTLTSNPSSTSSLSDDSTSPLSSPKDSKDYSAPDTLSPSIDDTSLTDDSHTDITDATALPDPSDSVAIPQSPEFSKTIYKFDFKPTPDPSYKVDWSSLCAIESRLVSEDQDAKLFVDQCNLKNKEDWDDYSLPVWSVSKLRSIIANSKNLPFNDIPNLPSINYDDPELSLWSALISDYRAVAQHIPKYASMMVRSGIPPALRGHAWKAMAESSSPTLESLYDSLAAEWTPFVKIIGRDLNRTFPEIKMFREKGGYGQMKLGRVLRAYSAYDIQVGYCQGLTFLAGPLLLHMDDRSAFCTLIQLMEDYDLRSMFTADMAGLQLRMYQFESLFSEQLPELYDYFKSLNVNNIYASQWFLSFFAVTCPLSMLVRIFDLVFSEGAIPTLMRVALAVLGRNQSVVMEFDDDEQILQHMLGRSIWDKYRLDADLLITDVSAVHVCTNQRLVDLETEFNEGGRPHMTNNTNSYTKPTPLDSSKRSASVASTGTTRSTSTSNTTSTTTITSANAPSAASAAPINNVAAYFTQFPWLKWQAPATPTTPTTTFGSNPVRPMSPAAAHSEPDLSATNYDRSRFSIASFDSLSTANSGSASSIVSFDSVGNRNSRVYGHQSSASSFTSYEAISSSASSVSSKNPPAQPTNSAKLVATLEENQLLKDKVSSLTAEIEKLRFELQQRERLSRVVEEERKEAQVSDVESSSGTSKTPVEHVCSSCEKLRLELALAKTNETLANAEMEELRHNLAKSKSTIATLSGNAGSASSNSSTATFPSSSSQKRAPSGTHTARRSIIVNCSNNFIDSKTPISLSPVPPRSGKSFHQSTSSDISSISSNQSNHLSPACSTIDESLASKDDDTVVVSQPVAGDAALDDKASVMSPSHSKGWSIW